MDPKRDAAVGVIPDEQPDPVAGGPTRAGGPSLDGGPTLGPWEQLAIGARLELEKWTGAQRHRRLMQRRRRFGED